MSTVISLREPTISLQSAVSSIRTSQAVYRDLHPTPVVALGGKFSTISDNSSDVKRCAHCKRRGHLCESCFHRIDTPDGSKQAAKNPNKATKVMKLRTKAANRFKPAKVESDHVSDDEESEAGVWIMEEHSLMSTSGPNKNNIILIGATC